MKIPIRQDITVLQSDDPKRLKIGWKISEHIGILIINQYGMNSCQIFESSEPHGKIDWNKVSWNIGR